MVLFGLKTHFKKISRLFLSPNPSFAKKLGQNGPSTSFYMERALEAPPPQLNVDTRGLNL